MDEDAASDTKEVADEDTVKQRIKQEHRKTEKANRATCRPRIDQLATPNRRLILNLYQDYANLFPKDKVERIKQKLQELYAMTPEETERYFEELRAKERKAEDRDRLKRMLRKLYLRAKSRKQEEKAYRFIEKLLREGMRTASENPVPPLVSVRLRNLSDIILEQLCDLRNIDIPSRENPDKSGAFMIAVADWMAVAIEQIYYMVQLKKNKELEEIEKQKKSDLDKAGSKSLETPPVTKSDVSEEKEKDELPQLEDETEIEKTPEDMYFE
ncbi:hypothetical protein JTB14_024719 [Gonioctena quinquepunctata]|nr:hypothetical protein JTB14_024719 [Gonioctena quinquepunctata]